MTVAGRAGGSGLPEGFVELAPLVYEGDPSWIPEDPAAIARAFGPGNPWLARNEAHAWCLPGQARAAAFCERDLLVNGKRAAFFGYWESTGDPGANRTILAEVEGWCRDRGAAVLYGPIQFATMIGYRLLLSIEPGGLPFPGEPYNPLSYPAQLEALGLTLDQRYYTQVIPVEDGVRAFAHRRSQLDKVLAGGYRIETLTGTRLVELLPELYQLIEPMFGSNFAFTPVPFEAFAALNTGPAAGRLCGETSVIAFGPDGDVAGLFLNYPHYGPLVSQGAGAERLPTSALDAIRLKERIQAHRPRGLIMKTLGTSPRHRQRGLGNALIASVVERAQGRYDQLYGALIRADNFSGRFFDGFKASERWYGLYAKAL